MQRIVVLNSKGGSGKTTVATNLATRLAMLNRQPVLLDLDPQASSIGWLARRAGREPAIHGIAGFRRVTATTRSWHLRLPPQCEAVVVDTPAAIATQELPEVTRGADVILVPVTPSQIDIQATAKCIGDLLLVAKVRKTNTRVGIVANRVKANTLVARSLMRFIDSLDIPLVATLRDSQNYVHAVELGLGIFEMPDYQARQDTERWLDLLQWLGRGSGYSGNTHIEPAAQSGLTSANG